MAVCKLAVISFVDNEDIGGYSRGDLLDCISQAQSNLEYGLNHLKYIPVDLKSFICWAKHKIKKGL